MTKANHTPGPWMAAAGPSSVVGWPVVERPRGRSVCSVSWLPGLPPEIQAEVRANATLIAAAPDLLHAAERALRVLKATGESVRPGNALGELEAAIAKATGAGQ